MAEPQDMTADAPDDDDRTVIRPVTKPLPELGNGLPMGTRLAEFELTQYLAEGGFGIVYLAYDHSLQRRVALKEYMPSSLAMRAAGQQVTVKSERLRDTFEAGRSSFVNEARLLASFDHRSLLKVYRFWEDNGTAYMVMPYLEGVTLKDHLKTLPGPPDEAWLLSLLGPLSEALQVLHAAQCYHRDIAPDNIMLLAGSQQPVLMDFGASRRVIGDMTQALTVILKPGYAPVEQYAEVPGMKQGPWTDIYALAAVVHFTITGKTPPASVARMLNDSFVPLAQAAVGRYSPGFLAAIDHALAVRPDDRTHSIAQLCGELGLGPQTPVDAPDRPVSTALAAAPASAQASPKSRLGLLVAGGLAAVALGLGVYQWLRAPVGPAGDSTSAATVAKPAAPSASTEGATAAGARRPGAADQAASGVAAGSMDMVTEFNRIVQAQTPGFDVQVSSNKTQLRIGHDQLTFTVQSNRDGYLYVQGLSSDGSLTLLYPNAIVGSPKITKDQSVTLPKKPIYFDATEPVGPSHLLVMVSAHERDLAVLKPRKDGMYRQMPTGAEAQRIAAEQAPTKVPLQAGRVLCGKTAGCEDLFGAATIRFDTVR